MYRDETFIRNLIQVRQRKGITIAELSVKTGLSTTILYKYEEGSAFPTVKNRKKLATALGITMDEFYK